MIVVGRAFSSVGGGSIGKNDIAILTELNRLDLDRVTELTGLTVADLWVQLDQTTACGRFTASAGAAGEP